jgi:hypothetical protein
VQLSKRFLGFTSHFFVDAPEWASLSWSASGAANQLIHQNPQNHKAGRKLWDHLVESPNFADEESEVQEGYVIHTVTE